MSRLPVPGSDDDVWGLILNDFLQVSNNNDGTLQPSAVVKAGAITNVNGVSPQNGGVTLSPADIGAYTFPGGGIPLTDLTTAAQTAIDNAVNAVQIGGDLGGIPSNPTIADLQGIVLNAGTPADGQVLSYNATDNQWVPATVSDSGVSDATASNKGILQLDGDLGGTAASPTVVNTNLSSPLPVNQGGTGSATQNFVDLSTTQTVGGNKSFSGSTVTGSLSTTTFKVSGGSPATGKVLTSDGSGNATWATLSTGSSTLAGDSDVTIASPSNNQVLTYNSTAGKWENEAISLPGNATSGAPGLIQLTGALGGSATSPTVVNTNLSSPLPVNQGGTGSATQNFVDLSSNQTIVGVKTFSGEVIVPAPVNATDAATKSYVDSAAQGLVTKQSVEAATVTTLPSNTYNNGSSGVGATLTASANAALVIDGYTVNTNDRLLIQNQVANADNGIYVATNTGSGSSAYVLTRSTDFDTSSQIPGAYVFVQNGTVNADAGFSCTTTGAVTFGTTAITWTQFSSTTQLTAGTGLTKSGNTISLTVPVAVSSGGTGSTTQNFVDLSSSQSIGGNKTLTGTTTTGTLDATSFSTTNLQVTGGSPATGKVLTSDGSGNAMWTTSQISGALINTNNLSDVSSITTARSNLGADQVLIPTTVKTGSYSANSGDFVPVDTSGGNVTITLPTAPADKSRIGIKMINTTGSNIVTFNTGGSDVFNKSGGPTSGTLTLLAQAIIIQYAATPAIWYVQDDDLPLSQLDGRYLASKGVVVSAAPTGSGQALVSTSSSTAGWSSLSYTYTQTWTVGGYVNVAQGDVDYINPIFVSSPSPQILQLISCQYIIHNDSSSSATVGIYQNGSLLTQFSNITVTTTKGTTTPGTPVSLSDGDTLQLVVASVNNTPLNMSFSIVLQVSI